VNKIKGKEKKGEVFATVTFSFFCTFRGHKNKKLEEKKNMIFFFFSLYFLLLLPGAGCGETLFFFLKKSISLFFFLLFLFCVFFVFFGKRGFCFAIKTPERRESGRFSSFLHSHEGGLNETKPNQKNEKMMAKRGIEKKK